MYFLTELNIIIIILTVVKTKLLIITFYHAILVTNTKHVPLCKRIKNED